MNPHYYSLNQYLQEQFHEKVYKLALLGGDTCPNRDGTKGTGGCIFCGEGSASYASGSIEEAIGRLQHKHTGSRYIAYFQSYTTTYRMSCGLIRRLNEAVSDERIAVLSLATRPDCLEPDVMDVLVDLQKRKPLWIELGLQTIHPGSAQRINRGYSLSCFKEAVEKLRKIQAEVIVHLILGLPGESREDILAGVAYLNRMDIQGVKLQLLHVLRNTPLGEWFLSDEGPFAEGVGADWPFTMEEYAVLICDCLAVLRPDIVVHRITGDAPKKDLLAPFWSGDKKKVLNTIYRVMEETGLIQGMNYGK